jgi:hypothetical protein
VTGSTMDPVVAELARLLARGYVRLLAERAACGLENDRVSTPKPLDSWAETRPPCASQEARP